MTDRTYIRVQYVNQRQGNRPPSIKDANGNYYTIQDNVVGWFQKGAEGDIGFYDKPNPRGGVYHIATEWNGQAFPRDQGQRSGGMQPVSQAAPQVQRPPAQTAPPQDIPPILSNVLAHAIEKGATPSDMPEWARWTAEAIKTFRNPSLPPPAPPAPGPDGDPGPTDDDLNDGPPF